jgi:hypothetical protein
LRPPGEVTTRGYRPPSVFVHSSRPSSSTYTTVQPTDTRQSDPNAGRPHEPNTFSVHGVVVHPNPTRRRRINVACSRERTEKVCVQGFVEGGTGKRRRPVRHAKPKSRATNAPGTPLGLSYRVPRRSLHPLGAPPSTMTQAAFHPEGTTWRSSFSAERNSTVDDTYSRLRSLAAVN